MILYKGSMAFIANAAQDGRQLKLDEARRLVHKSCVARSTARTWALTEGESMKKYIHINQHVIRRNKSNGYNEPVITVKTYKSNNYGHSVEVNGPCKIVYSPDKPLSCGARVWIETDASVSVTDASPAGSTKEVAWELEKMICCRGSFRTMAHCRPAIWRAAENSSEA